MAIASREKILQRIEVETTGIRLDMPQEEATFLLDMLNQVAGDPVKSRRAYADRIRIALEDAGVPRGPARFGGYGVADLTPGQDVLRFISGERAIP